MSSSDHAVASALASLIGTSAASFERVGGGRNSGVYRVTYNGDTFALKMFPLRDPQVRDRLRVENDALAFLAAHGITSIPRVRACAPEHDCLLLDWITGDPVRVPRDEDIDAAIEFLTAIHHLRCEPDARAQPAAAEACLSLAEICRQIQGRLSRLEAVAGQEVALGAFLDDAFRPVFAQAQRRAEDGYRQAEVGFDDLLPEAQRTLCPADFGFHNALQRPNGTLVFLDFDYFGWDDPVKLTCDFLLHPGMALIECQRRRFAVAACKTYGEDADFAVRLDLLYPLFGLRWCLILLNEFLPERWAIRRHAGADDDWSRAKRCQLEKAAMMLESLHKNHNAILQ